MEHEKRFESFSSNSQISFDQKTFEKLSQFQFLIKLWSKKMNLISYADQRDIYIKHFIPSFWFFEIVEKENPESILDVGTGAGFPGIILKILNPEMKLTLIESKKKKTLFLKEVADQLNINPIIVNERIENFERQSNQTFDVIISRAVTSVKQLWEWSKGLLRNDGSLFVLKGIDYNHEPDYKEINGLKIEEIKPSKKWISNSPNLINKLILKMRRP